MKKTIIILLTITCIVGIILIVFLMSRPSNTTQQPSTNEPTGIIVPTQKITNNELDIVQIDPVDRATNISINKTITITFSKNFSNNDIEFFISPNTEFTSEIVNNKLIIKPINAWSAGTNYSFSVNFINDNQKVRLYSFTTTGPTQQYLPDTQPEGVFEEQINNQKNNDPGLYVSNNTPYENAFFLATSEYESQSPAHFYLIITSKISDNVKVQQEVNTWLQTLDLTQDQIDSLDIRYQ